MILRFILFFGTFLFVLLGAHFSLYFSALHFFQVTDTGTKSFLLWATFLLAFSFFLSAFLIRLHGNPIFSAYYLFSAFWVGLLVQLLFAVVALWVLAGIFKLAGIGLPLFHVASVFFGLAFVVAMCGAWNAFHPKVTNIEIGLKNLPAEWQGKTVVQLSDVHLGAIHGVGFLNRVVDQVNALKPDLVLITGDLFDGMDGDLTGFIDPLDRIKFKEGVFFVSGNHEGYLGLKESMAVLGKTKIYHLKDEVKNVKGLQLVGLDFPMGNTTKDPKEVFGSAAYDPKKPTILMFHTPTTVLFSTQSIMSQRSDAYWSPNLDVSYAKSMGVDLQLSGHTHSGQFPPFSWISKLVFKNHVQGLFTDGDFKLYTSAGTGTWGPPIRLFNPSEIVAIKLKSN
jgi:hypothetical protein